MTVIIFWEKKKWLNFEQILKNGKQKFSIPIYKRYEKWKLHEIFPFHNDSHEVLQELFKKYAPNYAVEVLRIRGRTT